MSTMMYDVADDVKRDGYARVSHNGVINNCATELRIKGVDWEILLSNPNKISKLADAMKEYDMIYCWFDIPYRLWIIVPISHRNHIRYHV